MYLVWSLFAPRLFGLFSIHPGSEVDGVTVGFQLSNMGAFITNPTNPDGASGMVVFLLVEPHCGEKNVGP